LAAPTTDQKIRNKALKYLIDNFKDKYFAYDVEKATIPFLPCSDSNLYAKPLGCFTNPKCKVLNFQVLRQDLRDHATKFGVCENPSSIEISNKLIESPPQDENKAKEVFEYLASLETQEWFSLVDQNFIPIQNKSQSDKIVFISPNSCFFKKGTKKS
jgi:hypothetical protein